MLSNMKVDIEQKLRTFLGSRMPFNQECQVVYLLVEIRKILDHENDRGNNGRYPLLRFFSDWSVHTAKDRITPQIEATMTAILVEIKDRLSNKLLVNPDPKLIGFMSMAELRREMDQFLQEHSLPSDLIMLTGNWTSFQGLLASVLADQPLNEPCPGILKFAFKPAAPGCVMAEVHYETLPGTYEIFTMGGEF